MLSKASLTETWSTRWWRWSSRRRVEPRDRSS